MLKDMFASLKKFAVKAYKVIKENADVMLMSLGF